jgi:hypothetical protein
MQTTSLQTDRYGREFIVEHGESQAEPDLSAADASTGQPYSPSTKASEVIDFDDYYEV